MTPSWLPVKGRTYFVLGLSRTGLAACNWLLNQGAKVMAWDDNNQNKEIASKYSITITESPDWSYIAAVIQSPGIPLSHPISQKAINHKIPVITDIDLLRSSYPEATYIGITGTNGKSTTTALITHILRSCGLKAEMGGNIGIAALGLPSLEKGDVYVLELSSYQLEISEGLNLDYAVWLNVQPDHLERHGTMANYVAAKAKIFNGLQKAALIGADDDISLQQADSYKGAHITFSKNNPLARVYFDHTKLCVDGKNLLNYEEVEALRGDHNKQNVAAAFALASAMRLDENQVIEAIKTFPGLPHRQEIVGEKNGVTFVNDSKATNVDAASKALEVFDTIFWIAGGRHKGESLFPLAACKDRICEGFFIGESAALFQSFAKECGIESQISGDMETAVQTAYLAALAMTRFGRKAVILLSPATASFDQFKDFEARGDAFKKEVQELIDDSQKEVAHAH